MNKQLQQLQQAVVVVMNNGETEQERALRIISEHAAKVLQPVLDYANEVCRGEADAVVAHKLRQALASLEDVRLDDAIAELGEVFTVTGYDHYGEGSLWDAHDIHPAEASRIRHGVDTVLHFLIG